MCVHVCVRVLQMGELRDLCGQCGMDPRGSRMDIVSRIPKQMKNRDTYDKVFSQTWGASGNQTCLVTKCFEVVLTLLEIKPNHFKEMMGFCRLFNSFAVFSYCEMHYKL